MKQTNRLLTSAAIFGIMLTTVNVTFAQTPVKETTTTTRTLGTISEFGTDTIIVRSETALEPLRYSYTKTTTYVDEDGTPVSIKTVKSGLPVTVYYVRDGDRMVASKVIVRKAIVKEIPAPPAPPTIETKKVTTTTTTTTGTISEFGTDTIIVRSETAPAPIRYSYSKTTTYVDEDGAPVSIETVKSGLPVTVYYTKDGDRMAATKIIVRKTIK